MRTIAPASVLMQPLETRTLLAAEYNLFTLLGYDHRGDAWEYDSEGASTSTLFGDQDITGKTTITVLKKRQNIGGHLSNRVKVKSKALNLALAWARDANGTYITGTFATAFAGIEGLDLSVELEETRVAPKKMAVRTTYEDDGTFSGDVKYEMDDDLIEGTFEGTSHVESRLLGKRDVEVPAGEFRAVKGRVTLELEGTAQLDLGDLGTIDAEVHVTLKQVFFAVPNVGVVRITNELKSDLLFEGSEEPSTTTIDLLNELIEHIPAA